MKITTLEDHLTAEFGKTGTPNRDEFEAKAKAFYLCETLKEKRKKAGITQEQLAKATGLEKPYISRVENGKVDIQLSSFLRLLEGLGADLKIA